MNSRTVFLLACAVFLVSPHLDSARETGHERGPSHKTVEHLEKPDSEYVPVLRGDMPRSPAYRFSSTRFFASQVNVDILGDNIVGDAANEPSIAIDPNNPDRICIGWRQFDTINNSFRQAGYGYTTDGGETWTFPGVIEPGVFRSDPVLDSDSDGNFYYMSLTFLGDDYFCHVFKSTDGGATWDNGTLSYGGDKEWMVIDRTSIPTGPVTTATAIPISSPARPMET
jgi:hypothetical protein